MNTETIRTLNHEEEIMTTIRPCVLYDDRCCGNCKYYNSVSGTCSDGTSRSAGSWCRDFTWG